jgi:hypothetical protein
LIQGFDDREMGGLDASLDGPVAAQGGLAGEQGRQVLAVGPLLLGGGIRQGGMMFPEKREFQIADVFIQRFRGGLGR